DCEMFYDAPGSYASVVSDGNYTMRRTHIHHFSEGPRVGDNTTIEDCFIELPLVDDPEAHADGIQSTGAENLVIHHNTVDVSGNLGEDFANAAMIIGSEFAESDNIQITNNLVDGGGFTIFMGPSAEHGMSNVTF